MTNGEQLADEIDTADYTILSDNEATQLPTNGRSTSPDTSLASNDIALLSDWSVSTSLASDHLPILISIHSELSTIDGPRQTYINFKKADWARYSEACDEYVAEAVGKQTVEQCPQQLQVARCQCFKSVNAPNNSRCPDANASNQVMPPTTPGGQMPMLPIK